MFPECKFKWLLFLFALPLALTAQKDAPITLVNPSFEDLPKAGQTPTGWYNCGWPDTETPPDIQPGAFNVVVPPSNGSTYMGLVVRDNETYELVSQRLSRPLEMNQCYEFTLDLCRAELYFSKSRITDESANYVTPAKIRIYGGHGYCDRAELLDETPIIHNFRWLTYNFKFTDIKANYSYIVIEAYYKTPVLFPYNGNILVDNASPIRKVTCGADKMPDAKPKVAVKSPPTPTKVAAPKTAPAPSRTDTAVKRTIPEKPLVKMERKNVKTGKVFRLEKVYFDADKYEIKTESEGELFELFKFLRDNPDVAVEVGGHTNNKMWPNETFATELSTNRAKAVAEWLISKGISANRVQSKGYGWKYPIEPNTTEAGKRKNQRVEVKILKIDG